MEKKNNSMLDVANFLIVLVLGALVIDFVMAIACKRAEYNAYYRNMRDYVIVAFEVLVAARFIIKKVVCATSVFNRCRSSFSWRSFLYFWTFAAFIFLSVACYMNCINAVIEEKPIREFVYTLISLVVGSCLTMHFFKGYLRERLEAQKRKEQKKEERNKEEINDK